MKKTLFVFILIKLTIALITNLGLGDSLILGDSSLYLSNIEVETNFNRTNITIILIQLINSLSFGLAEYVLPILLAYTTHKLLIEFKVEDRYPTLILLTLFFLPSGLIWSSIAGKELIFIIAFSAYLLNRKDANTSAKQILSMACLALMFILRPTYALALFIIVELHIVKQHDNLLSSRISYILTLAFLLFALLTFDYVSMYQELLLTTQLSFQGGNTSFGIDLSNDFSLNLLITSSLNGIIGFSNINHLFEPRILLLAAEALFSIYLIFLFFKVRNLPFNRHRRNVRRKFALYTFSAIFIILLTQSIYGAFNAGSASRFRSNWLLPLALIVVVMHQRSKTKDSVYATK